MKNNIKTLEKEITTIKLFIEDHFSKNNNLINSIENNESKTPIENIPLIEHLQKTINRLEQENDSKTTIIKILAENSNTKSSSDTYTKQNEKFKVVQYKSNKNKYKSKDPLRTEIKCSNRYDSLYVTDSEYDSSSSEDTVTEPSKETF